jgi:MerR family copper efflux transcriptional regulator
MGPVASMNIGAVAAKTGLPPKTIRYYELIGLLPPAPRSSGGYRLYNAADIEVLRFVNRARLLGFATAEIASLLDLWRNKDRSADDVKALASKHIKNVDERIAELVSLRHALAELVERCQGDHRPECPILDEIANGRDEFVEWNRRSKPAPSDPY